MSSSSHILPPIDNLPTILETLDFHVENNADQAMYIYSENTEDQKITSISYLEFTRATHRIAHTFRPNHQRAGRQVVGVIMLVDSLLYQATTIGLMRAGLTPFPMSPRVTPAAVIHMMKKTDCHRIITTQETLQDLIAGIKTELASEPTPYDLQVDEMPNIREIFPNLGAETAKDPFVPYPTVNQDKDDTVLYLHSSGSTGFPKPIPLSFLSLYEWISFGMRALGAVEPRMRMGGQAAPSFHTLGIYTQLLHTVYCGAVVALYPPTVFSKKDLPITPTSDNILDHLRRTQCMGMVIIPSIVQIWSHSQEAIDYLKTLLMVGYSGGPLAEKLGNALAEAGVNVKVVYGATEFGAPAALQLVRGEEKDWEWMEFSPKTNIRWVEEGPGKYEAQFLTSGNHHPSVENMEDLRGYATSDLFEKHPTKPNHWRVVGRKDDVIIHSTGEKTVPAPMEGIMGSNSFVRDAIMFGREHEQAGVLIETTSEYTIDPTDLAQLAALRNKLWPIIEEANKGAPAYSRIYKEMILVASLEKPLPRAPKGTVMRKAALAAYNEEIEALYATVESSTSGENVVPPDNWELETVQKWILSHAEDIYTAAKLSTSKDLFEQGFDSLSATFLRLRITGALRASKELAKAVDAVTQNVVYNYPTLDALAEFITGIAADPSGSRPKKAQNGPEAIEEMIKKYTSGLDNSTSLGSSKAHERVVLLTGSTGNIGAQILTNLLEDKGVHRIYALNRSSSGSQTILDRHRTRFEDKGLDASLLKSEKLTLINGDTSEDRLGLDEATYNEIRNSVTVIVHGAWRLDFNLTLASFEGNVRGTRNLIDLARSSPHASSIRFLFMSSVSSAQSWDKSKGSYPEDTLLDASIAAGSGYGEGKYVTERILAQSGLQATSLRIGQVSGGLPNGAWATSDWVPILVKSSIALGALPNAPGFVSWIQMDAVAQAILDVGFAKKPPPGALNLVHPQPIPWVSMINSISGALAAELNIDALPLIPFKDWVARLEETSKTAKDGDLKKIPAVKLIDFFRGIAMNNEDFAKAKDGVFESGGLAIFQTDKAQEISRTMRNLPQVGTEDAKQWIGYWNRVGLFA